MKSWRSIAAPTIAQTIADVTGKRRPPFSDDEVKRIRAALRDRYPFGEREMWPYKVWCDEIRRQLGKPKKVRAEAVRQQQLFV